MRRTTIMAAMVVASCLPATALAQRIGTAAGSTVSTKVFTVAGGHTVVQVKTCVHEASVSFESTTCTTTLNGKLARVTTDTTSTATAAADGVPLLGITHIHRVVHYRHGHLAGQRVVKQQSIYSLHGGSRDLIVSRLCLPGNGCVAMARVPNPHLTNLVKRDPLYHR